MQSLEPKVFIGSSGEGRPYAEALLEIFHDEGVYARGWWETGIFTTGLSFLQALEGALTTFNAALLIGTPDDLTRARGKQTWKANGNVLLEYGMFLGAHGTLRTALATADPQGKLVLPSDLNGITHIQLTPWNGSRSAKALRQFKAINKDRITAWIATLHREYSPQGNFFRFPTVDAAFDYLTDQLHKVKASITHAAFSPPIPGWESKSSRYQKAIAEILRSNRIYYRYLAGIGLHRLEGIRTILSKYRIRVDPNERRYTPAALLQFGRYTGVNFHIFDEEEMHLYVPGNPGQQGASFLVHRSDIIRAYLTYYESLWGDAVIIEDPRKARKLGTIYEEVIGDLKVKLQTLSS